MLPLLIYLIYDSISDQEEAYMKIKHKRLEEARREHERELKMRVAESFVVKGDNRSEGCVIS